LREINQSNSFIVSKLIKNIIHSPNVSAIISENDVGIICITDQILRDNKYLGNIYPSKVSKDHIDTIIDITKIIGNYMRESGFRGIFGLDFIIDSDSKLYTIDLNPRRQGGYLCNILMKNLDLVSSELKCALGEDFQIPSQSDFTPTFSWAHSKIKPYFDWSRIIRDKKIGTPGLPFEVIGGYYEEIFYPKDSLFFGGCPGYIVVSGKEYDEVKNRLLESVEISISKDLSLYTI
jgi:biotin carboxylase